jgi:hypothetical protein
VLGLITRMVTEGTLYKYEVKYQTRAGQWE